MRLAALVVVVLLAAPASASALTATNARIASHPGFVRVVVDFSGGTFQVNEADDRVTNAQTGAVEAVAQSAKDGSLACLVQVRAGLNP